MERGMLIILGTATMRCDFVDLAQKGFFTHPVAHQGHDLRPSLRSCRLNINPPNSFSHS